jgi:hypothetical protein
MLVFRGILSVWVSDADDLRGILGRFESFGVPYGSHRQQRAPKNIHVVLKTTHN